MFNLKRFAFQTIRPEASGKSAFFPLASGRLAFCLFSKAKRSKNEPVNISCNKQQGAKDEQPLLPVVVAHFAIRRGTFCNVQRNTRIAPPLSHTLKKRAGEGMGGLGGRIVRTPFRWKGWASRASGDRMASQAAPVPTKETTDRNKERVLGKMGEFEGEETLFAASKRGFFPLKT